MTEKTSNIYRTSWSTNFEKMAKLDQATTKLNYYQHKLEKSKKKLEFWADKLTTQQNFLNIKECDLRNQVYTYNTRS